MADTTALKSSKLKPFTRDIPAGQLLFRQGELGDTMFVIVDGIVQLFDETREGQRLVGTFGQGEFFGEKSLMRETPHQRLFSAQAQTRTKVLQFRLQDIPYIQQYVPDLLLVIFQTAAQRLERAYHLIRVLKSPDDLERLIRSILYFYRSRSGDATRETMIISAEDLHYLIEMDKNTIRTYLDELTVGGALFKRPDGKYVIADERLLMEAIPLQQLDEDAA